MSYKDYRKRYDYNKIAGDIIRKPYITDVKNLLPAVMATAIVVKFMLDNDWYVSRYLFIYWASSYHLGNERIIQ